MSATSVLCLEWQFFISGGLLLVPPDRATCGGKKEKLAKERDAALFLALR